LCYYESYTNIASLLINYGINKYIKDKDGNLPIHMASELYNLNLIKLLLKDGVDINEVNYNGETPLHKACIKSRNIEMIKYLIEHGSDINKTNNYGETPLMRACSKLTACDYEVLKYLIDHGADINKVNNNGETPFLISCKVGNEVFAMVLLNNGADINKPDNKGNTPLFIACKYIKLGVKLPLDLVEMGADINVVNNNGETPLTAARLSKHENAVKCLVELGAKEK